MHKKDILYHDDGSSGFPVQKDNANVRKNFEKNFSSDFIFTKKKIEKCVQAGFAVADYESVIRFL